MKQREIPKTIWVFDLSQEHRQGADPWNEYTVVGETSRSILIEKYPGSRFEPDKVPKGPFLRQGFIGVYYDRDTKEQHEWLRQNRHRIMDDLRRIEGWDAWVIFGTIEQKLKERKAK